MQEILDIAIGDLNINLEEQSDKRYPEDIRFISVERSVKSWSLKIFNHIAHK